MARNEGWVNVGIDHDTAELAVESIRRWWWRMGRYAYPNATELLITADAGGSNGYRAPAVQRANGRHLRPSFQGDWKYVIGCRMLQKLMDAALGSSDARRVLKRLAMGLWVMRSICQVTSRHIGPNQS